MDNISQDDITQLKLKIARLKNKNSITQKEQYNKLSNELFCLLNNRYKWLQEERVKERKNILKMNANDYKKDYRYLKSLEMN